MWILTYVRMMIFYFKNLIVFFDYKYMENYNDRKYIYLDEQGFGKIGGIICN